ncbi:NAD(P)-dependent glycerol-3-phosphate dehydrogenase [Tianweitania sp. BSSL-BM11]|uniref:Glycerol-3-phosphate dehydrogenase [NAD(P)+] n=1 Tax=Tianweitania aestuarii TaxID=2814886 RepID=A0ABS5RX51_9HYPH|nr:NAD(P)H-dependent glycerol-3-phosphate dehydrogenase [Tianweitania aestuarii]MBS9721594.1 NAD(P)-dependent glycerol-3-phosphate dehydrogenase [Tianweitania aestuarii]
MSVNTSNGRIAVLGGGAWGTALANTFAAAGRPTLLWARDAETVAAINGQAANPRYLPGIALDPALRATTDAAQALQGAGAILSVVPAQIFGSVLQSLADHIPAGLPIVICAKGIERATGLLPSAVLQATLPDNPPAALSGPSFATDLARGLPTAVTVAARDRELAAELAANLSTPRLRCYSADDLTGVEIGGALKNVLALAAGAAAGAGLGASAQAALITRGFVELRRIGAALGAQGETLMGLSGLGDLMLTCGSGQSRNFAYGEALGRGEPLENRPLAEGVATASIAARIAREHAIAAPIITAVDAILKGESTIAQTVEALMTRPLKHEAD